MAKKTAPQSTVAGENAKLKKKPWYREYGEALIIAGILALIIRSFVIQAFKIPSGSMEDTLLIGDHLLVNKFIYGVTVPFTDSIILPVREPRRGDVIVFEFPEDRGKGYFQRRDFIKRIVAVPGDTVRVSEKQVFVNGEPVSFDQEVHKDPFLQGDDPRCLAADSFPRPPFCRDFMPAVEVPPDRYFVMGDNRDRSYDSRFWGFVRRDEIKGLAFILYWSWNGEENWPRWNRIGKAIP